MTIDFLRARRWRARYVAAPILAAVALGACGGSTAVESADAPSSVDGAPAEPSAAQTAAANEATLQSADVEQFARDHSDIIQVVGLGAQDDFPFAEEFVDTGGLETPTMLWDPTFATWQAFGVNTNSQMIILSPDLTQGSNLIFGFDESQREAILELASNI